MIVTVDCRFCLTNNVLDVVNSKFEIIINFDVFLLKLFTNIISLL